MLCHNYTRGYDSCLIQSIGNVAQQRHNDIAICPLFIFILNFYFTSTRIHRSLIITMFDSGPNYSKLKTNLRLAVNRLKLLEKKNTELALKARKEIADYIAAGKAERGYILKTHTCYKFILNIFFMFISSSLCSQNQGRANHQRRLPCRGYGTLGDVL